MKILYIGTGTYPIRKEGPGAVEKIIYNIIDGLSHKGHYIDVVDIEDFKSSDLHGYVNFYKASSLSTQYEKPDSISAYRIIKLFIFSVKSLIIFRNLIRKNDYDIIHINTQIPACLLILHNFLLGLNIPIVYTSHNSFLFKNINNYRRALYVAEIISMKLANCVIVLTQKHKNDLGKFLKIPLDKVEVIPNGLDFKTIDHSPSKNNVNKNSYILCVSRVSRRKNQLIVIKSFSEVLKKHNVDLILAGPIDDLEYYNEICDFVRINSLGDSIKILGMVDEAYLHKLYRNARLFIFPTFNEAFPLVFLEACSFGLPIIASKIDVLEEIAEPIKDHISWFNPTNHKELAKLIIELLENNADSFNKDVAMFSESYSWDNIINLLEKLYININKR